MIRYGNVRQPLDLGSPIRLIKAVLTIGELGMNVQINAPQTLHLRCQVGAPRLAG